MSAQAPWWPGGGRSLATTDYLGHIDDLVRIVLLTGIGERLHRPGFGAGLSASAQFEPLSDALGATVTARVRGSLSDALGDRIQVLDVGIAIEDARLSATVTYRPLPAGERRTVSLPLPEAAP